MTAFQCGHATHPDWRMATDLAMTQLGSPALAHDRSPFGLVYASAAFADAFESIIERLQDRRPGVTWAGACVPGVCAPNAEYLDEPAVGILLGDVPAASLMPFSVSDDGFASAMPALLRPGCSVLLHADPHAGGLEHLIESTFSRVEPGRVFGGLLTGDAAGSGHVAGHCVRGGSSGLVFGRAARLLSRVTQGCAPIAREHVITACRGQYIESLDGRPALDVMLEDLGVDDHVRQSGDGEAILQAMRSGSALRPSQGLLLGIAPPGQTGPIGMSGLRMRTVIGIDPINRMIAVAGEAVAETRAVFCGRDARSARADLVRICTELREDLESEGLKPRGVHYVSCLARGRHLFGASGTELGLISHNLGDIPLLGFFANGEIADNQLHSYTGVLTVFV
jgi:small ligand-binding sensory domain FIST